VGTRRIYSNAGFELLAEELARRSGIAFGDYLDEALFGPLEMVGATLEGSAAYGAYAGIEDLCCFAAELFSPRLLAPETLRQATSVAFPGLAGVVPGFGRQDPCDWGLGFELRGEKTPHWTGAHNAPETFGHFGQSGTFLLLDPVAELALVVLSDRRFGSWAAEAWPVLIDAVLVQWAR
jgi:CubicO group peptidase (beta-lactamase class C family)